MTTHEPRVALHNDPARTTPVHEMTAEEVALCHHYATPPERKSILDFIDVSPAACTARRELNAARELCGATIDNPAEFAVARALLAEALTNLDRFYRAKRAHGAP